MKWTLVTGGAKRLGAEICRTLAKQGHNILVHYNTSKTDAKKIVDECVSHGVKAVSIQGDFTTPESTEKFIKALQTYPEIENLINNVGNYLVKPATATTDEEWQTLFQINFHAPVSLIQTLLPSLKKSHGNIINIGVSGLETMRANTTFPAYLATKSSLLLMTKSYAKELASFGVRVNMVSPGQLENSIDRPESPKAIPIGRFGTTTDVARVISFLIAKESSYITGQNIEVAGGLGL